MVLTRLEQIARIYPNNWPDRVLDVQPGDMTQFAPMGMGIGGPMIMMPWGDLDDMVQRPGYYSFHEQTFHPQRGAPVTEAAGGTIYFDRPKQDDFDALLRLLEVNTERRDYAVFAHESENPLRDRYVLQLRIMGFGAVEHVYKAPLSKVPEGNEPQKKTLGQLLWAFIEFEQQRHGGGYSSSLSGCLGGDGDWARETLCFGFMVENACHRIYRLWSRATLVTK